MSVAVNSTSKTVDLTCNHPTKCMYVIQRPSLTTGQTSVNALEYFNWAGNETGKYTGEAFLSMKLTLNGNEHSSSEDSQGPLWYRGVKCHGHFRRIPRKHVYPYPFSLRPLMDYGSTGVLNFSKVDTAKLIFTYTAATCAASDIFVYFQSLNVLTIENGQVQLRFAS